MGLINVFFNTRIKDTQKQFSRFWGRPLNGLANFFLMPVRLVSSGKTVRIEANNDLSKVSSFYHVDWNYLYGAEPKNSKQSDELKSTKWSEAPMMMLVSVLLYIPFGAIGGFLKLLSCADPKVRQANKLVRDKLTKQTATLGNEELVGTEAPNLQQTLQNQLNTGQKLSELVIHANEPMNADHLKLIKDINAAKTVWVGTVGEIKPVDAVNTFMSTQNRNKFLKWDLTALKIDVDRVDTQSDKRLKKGTFKDTLPLKKPSENSSSYAHAARSMFKRSVTKKHTIEVKASSEPKATPN